MQLACYRCERCTSKRELQVHHKCYDRLGREWDQDLEVLCDTCHGGHHEADQARRGTSIRLYLKLVGLKLHSAAVDTFSDLAEAVKSECAKLRIPYDSDRIGQAIALATAKLPPKASAAEHAALVSSQLPINKADALRIVFSLSEQQQDQPLIRLMPALSTPAIEDAHRARLRDQVAEVQREEYQREARRQPLRERLEAIFTERPW